MSVAIASKSSTTALSATKRFVEESESEGAVDGRWRQINDYVGIQYAMMWCQISNFKIRSGADLSQGFTLGSLFSNSSSAILKFDFEFEVAKNANPRVIWCAKRFSRVVSLRPLFPS